MTLRAQLFPPTLSSSPWGGKSCVLALQARLGEASFGQFRLPNRPKNQQFYKKEKCFSSRKLERRTTSSSIFNPFFVFWVGRQPKIIGWGTLFQFIFDQKINNFTKNEKVFFIEKTRAVDNFNLDFYSFFRFLGWPPAENNRLGDTFSIYFIFFEWSFSRENSSGGQLFSKKKRWFLAWTEILARVFSKKRHFLAHRETAGPQAFSNP